MLILVFQENARKSSLFECNKFRTEADELWLSYVGQSCYTNHCWSYFTTSLFSVGLKRLYGALSSLPFTPTKSLYGESLCNWLHDPLQPVTWIPGLLFITLMCSCSNCCNTLGFKLNFNRWLELSTVVFTLQWHGLGTFSVSVSDELSQCDEDNLRMAIWPF